MAAFLERELKRWTCSACGGVICVHTGMCGGCRVTVGGQTKFACVDGPDFDGHLVDFDSLMKRNSLYRSEEEHICRMKGVL